MELYTFGAYTVGLTDDNRYAIYDCEGTEVKNGRYIGENNGERAYVVYYNYYYRRKPHQKSNDEVSVLNRYMQKSIKIETDEYYEG